MMLIKCSVTFVLTSLESSRYEADCTVLTAQGGVATPWNGTTIPPRRALPCTPITAHSTPSNRRF